MQESNNGVLLSYLENIVHQNIHHKVFFHEVNKARNAVAQDTLSLLVDSLFLVNSNNDRLCYNFGHSEHRVGSGEISKIRSLVNF